MPRDGFRVQFGDPFQAGQRIFLPSTARKKIGSKIVLLDGFRHAVLLLQKQRIAGNALRRLLPAGLQKPAVNGYGLGLIFAFGEKVEERTVIHGGAVGLIQPRVEVAQRLSGFLVRGRLFQHRQIGLNGILDFVPFQEAFGSVQMPADVDCHGRGDVFLSKTFSKTQKTIAPAGVGNQARRNLLTIYRTCSLHQNNRASPVRNRTRPPSLFPSGKSAGQCRP